MDPRRRAALVALPVVALASSPAIATATCSYDSGVVTVVATGDTVVDRAATGEIRVDGSACGAATVTNTDLIAVEAGPHTVTFDVANAFAPGLTPEAEGTSEIEITWHGDGDLALRGGDGADRLRFLDDGVHLDADADADLTVTGTPGVTMDGGNGADTLVGSGWNDVLRGGAGNDVITSGFGYDTVDGGDGDDLILEGQGYGFEHDVIDGGAGTDRLSYAGRGDAVVVGYEGPVDRPRQYVDRDEISGVENVTGGNGADVLYGDAGPNAIDGGPGNDEIHGGEGDDVLSGGAGDDLLVEDALPNGADVVSGGPGRDLADYGRRFLPSTISLDDQPGDGAPNENDDVRSDVEDLWGGQAGDVLTGSGAVNHFWGFGGGDVFRLDDGVLDYAYGGEGVDVLYRDALDNAYEMELLLPP